MFSTASHYSLFLLIELSLISFLSAQYRHQPIRQDELFSRYEETLARRRDNLCPYTQIGSDKIPLLSWMCGVPISVYGRGNDRYTYDCCPGYSRSDLIENRCVALERSWKSIVEFLREKRHDQTVYALEFNSGQPDLIAKPSKSVYTVFVPKSDGELTSGEIDYMRTPNSAGVMIHNGRIYSNKFKNGVVIRNERGGHMKITSYSTGLTFIECRLLMSVDQETENGLIHMTDGPLPATHEYSSVMSRLESDPEISEFVRAIPEETKRLLRQPNSRTWYTVFAPTNAAWRQATAGIQSPQAIDELARKHVLNKMICSRAVTQETSKIGTRSNHGSIKMSIRSDGTTYIIDDCHNEINYIKRDLMSGNGAVHQIDRALTSYEAQGLGETLQCLASDGNNVASQSIRNYANCHFNFGPSERKVILLPTDRAISELPSDLAHRMQTDQRFMCDVYAYGILTPHNGQLKPDIRGLNQATEFMTEYRTGDQQPTYVTNTYARYRTGSKLWFNDATAVNIKGLDFRDGVIYYVNKVNFPPTRTMRELLYEQSGMSTTTRKVDETSISNEWSRLSPKVLFLAPSDMGWSNRPENDYSSSQMQSLLQLHTIPLPVFGGKNGFVWRQTLQDLPTLLPDGRGGYVHLRIKRYLDGTTFIGHRDIPEQQWAMVTHWNLVGTDGLIWIVDWPIACPNGLCR